MTFAAARAGQNSGGWLGLALVGSLLAAGGDQGLACGEPDSAAPMEVFLTVGSSLIGGILLGLVVLVPNLDKRFPAIRRDLPECHAGLDTATS